MKNLVVKTQLALRLANSAYVADPLPSWNDGSAKEASLRPS